MFKDVKFLATTAQPSYKEVSHWIDLLEDPTGGTIKVWNGTGWKKISGEGDSDTGLVIGDTTGTAFDGGRGKAVEDKLSEGFIINHYLDNNLSNGNEVVLTRIGVSGETGEKYYAQDTIPSATTTKAGVMSAADKQKLDSLSTESDVYVIDYITENDGTVTLELYNELKSAIESNKIIIFLNGGVRVSMLLIYIYADSTLELLYSFDLEISLDGHVSSLITIKIKSDLTYSVKTNSFSIKTNGDGTKFLSDDGRYKEIDLSSKQDTLVSGTNIKSINNQSLLGEGNIDIAAGDSKVYVFELSKYIHDNISGLRFTGTIADEDYDALTDAIVSGKIILAALVSGGTIPGYTPLQVVILDGEFYLKGEFIYGPICLEITKNTKTYQGYFYSETVEANDSSTVTVSPLPDELIHIQSGTSTLTNITVGSYYNFRLLVTTEDQSVVLNIGGLTGCIGATLSNGSEITLEANSKYEIDVNNNIAVVAKINSVNRLE